MAILRTEDLFTFRKRFFTGPVLSLSKGQNGSMAEPLVFEHPQRRWFLITIKLINSDSQVDTIGILFFFDMYHRFKT